MLSVLSRVVSVVCELVNLIADCTKFHVVKLSGQKNPYFKDRLCIKERSANSD